MTRFSPESRNTKECCGHTITHHMTGTIECIKVHSHIGLHGAWINDSDSGFKMLTEWDDETFEDERK